MKCMAAVALASLAVACAAPSAQAPLSAPLEFSPPSAAAPEHAFDFMIGDWRTTGRVLQDGGVLSEPKYGRLSARRHFEPTGVASVVIEISQTPEDNPGAEPSEVTTYGATEIYVRHPETGAWRGISNNSLGNRKWIEAEVGDGEVAALKSGELFEGAQGVTRFVYHDIAPDAFALRVDYSRDGETWVEGTYVMTAERAAD